ncbi:hypothetical protein LEP1GSC196_0455 [Leptospira meyeri serovar Semaranga str. Veldrot Semarang 173]|nr:hypothetical protein LEP1GSC196_0455 [Leptospira meyeri serovar Semaranga str. Veldrot Semarang 173]
MKLLVWNGFSVIKPPYNYGSSTKWLVSGQRLSPTYFPTKTVRLLI